ncbi:phenylalanine 4-monooxygenase [Pleionea sp. CnH1-48]|uniref:phenylalanine 4-monooxygenase n=1 Tax=Pleionea sp. CnH1-48 TaxID=2954494 RepID=UPI00209777DD|nr:phenylalanine 4-monooxygenase [Pleionea sp. CnH1-48]MCO7227212.1 phenylalanine 4-monooxygenase [Pleionea sp. CnH1-48]
MGKSSKYVARKADENGFIHYTDEEHQIWSELYERQIKLIDGKACDEYMEGLDILNLPKDRIPQLEEVSSILRKKTGWEVAWVPALISFEKFFALLADKKFPCATFIRTREEMNYLQEPDVFHEIFGHCAMLTNPYFAEFTHTYGRLGANADKQYHVWLARLYWFTVEFGLIKTGQGDRIYGGGILSSIGESQYALSDEPEHRPFDIMNVLRTPYRIDIMQPIYFCIEDMKQLFDIAHMDIMSHVKEAKSLGLFEPTYPPKEDKMAS